MEPNAKLLIEELMKQVREEISKGFAAHDESLNVRMAASEQKWDERVGALESAAADFDQSFAQWKPSVESAISSVKLELTKLNSFFDREAKGPQAPQDGVLHVDSAPERPPAGSPADGPNFGQQVDPHIRDSGHGSVFTHSHIPVKGKKRKQEKHKTLVLGDFITSEGFGEGSPSEGFEFSVVRFSDITTVTNNFHQSFLIGQGGFGKVYKANLDGREVAIKRLNRDSEQGIAEFRNEVILIAKLQHKNLVRFLGCCIEGDEKLLIFEYMPNKSLDSLLFGRTRKTALDWPTRFNIIKGVAKGLLYIHQDSRMKIIHRDLKASNILLDEEMRPKIADFGMARMFNDNQQNANTKRVVGTYGYMAPEYAMRGIFSVKSDVYSFGVLTLEIASGVKISSTDHIMEFENLVVYAWNLWNEGKAKDLLDSSIVDSCIMDEALLCIHLGLLCVQDNPNDRPLMSSAVFILENGSTTLPAPNKPVYFAHKIEALYGAH